MTSQLPEPEVISELSIHYTSRSAIAGNPRCSVYKLWQKYKCKRCTSNIALSYSIDVDKWSFDCFTSLCLYL